LWAEAPILKKGDKVEQEAPPSVTGQPESRDPTSEIEVLGVAMIREDTSDVEVFGVATIPEDFADAEVLRVMVPLEDTWNSCCI